MGQKPVPNITPFQEGRLHLASCLCLPSLVSVGGAKPTCRVAPRGAPPPHGVPAPFSSSQPATSTGRNCFGSDPQQPTGLPKMVILGLSSGLPLQTLAVGSHDSRCFFQDVAPVDVPPQLFAQLVHCNRATPRVKRRRMPRCCPKLNNMGINGSPCSPTSHWRM